MKAPKIKSRIIVPHSRGCFAIGRETEWSGLLDGHYWGNFAANKNTNSNHGNYHIWHRMVCNDPKCPGIKAVHSSVLVNA